MGNKTKVEFMRWIEKNLPEQPKAIELEEPDPRFAGAYDEGQHVESNERTKKPNPVLAELEAAAAEEDPEDCVPKEPEEQFKLLKAEIDEVEEIVGEVAEQMQEELDVILATLKEEGLKDIERYDKLAEKMDIIEFSIKNRNRIEDTQSRFNFSHLAIFISFGGFLGSAISIVLARFQKKEKDSLYNV
jgi:hypothetical protein